VKCPDGRVTRNQDAFEPHSVLGIHLVVPLLEPREQVEQEIRRSLGTSSLPRRLHQTALLKSPLPYFGGTGTSPSSAFFPAAAASLRRVRLVSRNSGLPIVPVAQTGFLVALRREEGDRGAFDHFADELRDREARATDERLGHGEEGAVGLRRAGKLVRRGERGAGSGEGVHGSRVVSPGGSVPQCTRTPSCQSPRWRRMRSMTTSSSMSEKDTLSGCCLPFDRYLISRLGILPRGRGGTALAARYFGALREAEVRFAALSARSFCSD
jgi:hypothetical protein